MKKLLLAIVAALGAALAFRRVRRGRDEQELWSEATDPVTPSGA